MVAGNLAITANMSTIQNYNAFTVDEVVEY